MSSGQDQPPRARTPGPFASLRRFAQRRAAIEPCDLCGAALEGEHSHLLNTAERKLLCACSACVILLSGGAGARFRQVPARVEFWADFRLTDTQWESLRIPIQLAFFLRTADRVVALYPGPAGITESIPPPQAWSELMADNPRLAQLEPDVEALLISRLRDSRGAYRVPIDQCYRLTGLIRTRWRGFSGGSEVWQQVRGFFDELRRKSQAAEGACDA